MFLSRARNMTLCYFHHVSRIVYTCIKELARARVSAARWRGRNFLHIKFRLQHGLTVFRLGIFYGWRQLFPVVFTVLLLFSLFTNDIRAYLLSLISPQNAGQQKKNETRRPPTSSPPPNLIRNSLFRRCRFTHNTFIIARTSRTKRTTNITIDWTINLPLRIRVFSHALELFLFIHSYFFFARHE